MIKHKPEKSEIRPDILRAIRKAWPDGVVEAPLDSEESYFAELYPRLCRDLSKIEGARLVYERQAEAQQHWNEGSDADEDPPDWEEPERSYHLFFVVPDGEVFRYETETEEPVDEEEEKLVTVSGQGMIGCSAGVSLVARFAIVTVGDMENFESGSCSPPDVEMSVYRASGGRMAPYEYLAEMKYTEEEIQIVKRLEAAMAGILQAHGISLLPEEEWGKRVPRLRGGEETVLAGQPITVKEAFFFQGI